MMDFPNCGWLYPYGDVTPVDDLTATTRAYVKAKAGSYGLHCNIETFSAVVVDVPMDQPHVPVYVDKNNDWIPDSIPSWGGLPLAFRQHGVPIPAGVAPQADSDSALIVVKRDPVGRIVEEYELWKYRIHADGRIFCSHGGRKINMLEPQGFYHGSGYVTTRSDGSKSVPYTYQSSDMGTMATGVPMLSTVLNREDLERGYADHPVGIAMPGVGTPVRQRWPAQRHDGGSSTQFPQGTRVRFPFDTLVPADATRAEACFIRTMRMYGGIHIDTVYGSVPVIRLGQDCREFLDGQSHLRVSKLPLDRLEVLPENYLNPAVPA
jgi:hypothetical protein